MMLDEEPFAEREEFEVEMAKYRYARVFLEYLDAAKRLLDLQALLPDVEQARNLIENGREIGRDYEEISIAMERALYPLRNIDRPLERLEYLVGRFDVDMGIAKDNESRLWECLVSAVNDVPDNESWDVDLWYEGSMSGQRDLLTVDTRAADRILCYQRLLNNALFDYTPCPDALEVYFRLSFGHLVDVVPFAL